MFLATLFFGEYAGVPKWKIQEFVVLACVTSWIIFWTARFIAFLQLTVVYAGIGLLYAAEFVVRIVSHAHKGMLSATVSLAGLIGSLVALFALALQSF
jgi:hypothetical protein